MKRSLWVFVLLLSWLQSLNSVYAATHCPNLDSGVFDPNHPPAIQDPSDFRLYDIQSKYYHPDHIETCNAFTEYSISLSNVYKPYFWIDYLGDGRPYYCTILLNSTYNNGVYDCDNTNKAASYLLHYKDSTFHFVSTDDVVSNIQEDKACGDPEHSVGNPINLENCSKFQQEIDYQSATSELTFSRHYDSLSNNNTALGRAWRHNYEHSLSLEYSLPPIAWSNTPASLSSLYPNKKDACEQGWDDIKLTAMGGNYSSAVVFWNATNETCHVMDSNQAVATVRLHQYGEEVNAPPPVIVAARLQRANGRVILYSRDSNGNYIAPLDIPGSLVNTGSQWIHTTIVGTVETYASDGRLLSIQQRNGQTQTLNYNANNQLASVIGPFSRTLTFNYNTEGRINSITLPDSETLDYAYNPNGLLISVTQADDSSFTYHYEDVRDPKLLTGITDGLGNRYASWQYDDEGRATSSEHSNGVEAVQVHYDDLWHTRVTYAEGLEETYTWTLVQNRKRIQQKQRQSCVTCPIETMSYSYDPNGFISSLTDFEGNVTTYINNARGSETSRTEASGTPQARTITTEWHATYRLPTKITEPGKETIFTYDSNGKLLSRTERAL